MWIGYCCHHITWCISGLVKNSFLNSEKKIFLRIYGGICQALFSFSASYVTFGQTSEVVKGSKIRIPMSLNAWIIIKKSPKSKWYTIILTYKFADNFYHNLVGDTSTFSQFLNKCMSVNNGKEVITITIQFYRVRKLPFSLEFEMSN